MSFISWYAWAVGGFEYEDWPDDAKEQYQEYLDLKRQEQWERDHGMEG